METPETVFINSYDKKEIHKMNNYILHNFLLVTILLLKIIIICCDCVKHQSKQKGILPHCINNVKWQGIMNLKKLIWKIVRIIVLTTWSKKHKSRCKKI